MYYVGYFVSHKKRTRNNALSCLISSDNEVLPGRDFNHAIRSEASTPSHKHTCGIKVRFKTHNAQQSDMAYSLDNDTNLVLSAF